MTTNEAKKNMEEKVKFLKSELRHTLSSKSRRTKMLKKEKESIEKILETLENYKAEIEKRDDDLQVADRQYKELGKEIKKYFKEVLKQDKMINLMAEQLKGKNVIDEYNQEIFELGDKDEVITYFRNKAC